jgi:hypothetical protein
MMLYFEVFTISSIPFKTEAKNGFSILGIITQICAWFLAFANVTQ